MKNTVLFISGEGGHVEQARRLMAAFEPDVRTESYCVLVTDSSAVDASGFDDCWVIVTCAPKFRVAGARDLLDYGISSLRVLWRIALTHDVRVAIVTGPGFATVPALGARLFGARLLVFETWSRLEQRSKCGKALYRFAHEFYVQHRELLNLYPKATFIGLL